MRHMLAGSPESKFNLALLFDTSLSELNLTSDIKVATEQEMNIDVSASLNGRLDNYKEILGCNVIFCRAAFIEISTTSLILMRNESLVGHPVAQSPAQ